MISDYPYDSDLFEATRSDRVARWRVYVPPHAMVVLGYGSRAEREIHADRCEADGIPVYRRRGGGCSVVLDPGVVVATITVPVEGIAGTRGWFDRFTDWLATGLMRAGIHGIGKAGIFDLVIDGRKIAGGSTHRTREALLWTASVLVTPPVELMRQYLQHPPREPDYRAHRDHGEFVMGVREAGWKGDARDLASSLRMTLEPAGEWSALGPDQDYPGPEQGGATGQGQA